MMSLFNSFDLALFPFSIFILLALILMKTKNLNHFNKNSLLMKSLNLFLCKFFYSLKNMNFQKVMMLVLNSVFFTILMSNFTSISPFVFPLTSQISMVLSASLTFWLSVMVLPLILNTKNLISHLTPSGSPYILVPFLFLIEMISMLIRPITVSVRLVANILAGHLLMILLSKLVLTNMLMSPAYILLNMAELAVAAIQAYIFCTMISLYYSEI